MGKLSSDIRRKVNNQSSVNLTVDLKEIFDLPFFPKDDGLRQSIGQAVLDKIKENASDAKFLDGSSGKKYSKAYSESDAGIVYGKQRGGSPTLRASGDMLESMVVGLPDNFNEIVIEFSDATESEKAHGHINGSDVLPKRDFFGLDQADVNKIRRQFDSVVVDALALEMAGEVISQGEETDLDFISRLLNGEG